MMRILVCFLCFALFAFVGAASAQSPVGKTSTLVTSEKMISESSIHRIRFMGNVEAIHGDLNLRSDTLEVYSDPAQENVEKIVAIGNVVITKEGRVVKGDSAELYAAEKKLIITGNASVSEEKNLVTGEKIIYFYDREDIIVSSGEGGRATLKLGPDATGGE